VPRQILFATCARYRSLTFVAGREAEQSWSNIKVGFCLYISVQKSGPLTTDATGTEGDVIVPNRVGSAAIGLPPQTPIRRIRYIRGSPTRLRGSESWDRGSVDPGLDLAATPTEMEFDAIPGVGCDGDGASNSLGAAVGHNRIVISTVPVQDAELSAHAQGLSDGVGHCHVRRVVLRDRVKEIRVVPSVDITAPEAHGTQTLNAVQYVV